MKKIILSGYLGKKFGRVHFFDVKNVSEAVRALSANFKEFRTDLIENDKKGIGYKVLFRKDGVRADEDFFNPVQSDEEINIVPVVAGADSGPLKIIAGVVLIAIGVVFSATGFGAALIPVGISLVVGGVVQLLTPIPKAPSAPNREDDGKAGYQFNGPVNTTVQGFPVAVGYGKLVVGSAVISAGITIEDISE